MPEGSRDGNSGNVAASGEDDMEIAHASDNIEAEAENAGDGKLTSDESSSLSLSLFCSSAFSLCLR